ncbi:MAG: hypothetical protein HS111_21455 [Kofleriaceae bacterium]|nr:hypothetical protein [Kofleriaceae bacterium]MCL4223154.1 hypothetical protein [Myxococcales bacterium]
MSILILGHTMCPLCGRAVHERRDAVQLPYAAPSAPSELPPLGRQYVHRSCWLSWSKRERYARAAAGLLASNRGELGRQADVLESERLVWYELPGKQGFRFEDLEELVALQAPADHLRAAADWLAAIATSAETPAPLVLPAERWAARVQDSRLWFARYRGDEIIEEAVVHRDRVRAWERMFRAMCEAAAMSPSPEK